MGGKSQDLHVWRSQDSSDLYQVSAWGDGYFEVGQDGQIEVRPDRTSEQRVKLHDLVDDLAERGYELPILLRFSGILKDRVRSLSEAFGEATSNYGYTGRYRPVFPIKVNQQRDVVEELVEHGRPFGLGLEAGSKPEVLVALAHMDNEDGLIICNGYKDDGYIETVLLAQKLGRHAIMVIDRFDELQTAIRVSRKLDMKPHLGVRARLAAKGAGKWVESTGDRSKFGLSASELVRAVALLRSQGMLDCLELLHFHIGSQITSIRAIKGALREASRTYVELCELGAGLNTIDIGGGLAVDYDGSKTNFHSSANYGLQEYANDVVAEIQQACDDRGIAHPDIVSESGRALVAHHSVLIFDVLGRAGVPLQEPPESAKEHESQPIRAMYEAWETLSLKTAQECYHDALQFKEESLSLFNLGYLDLEGRALAESIFWAICARIRRMYEGQDHVPEEFQGLERLLADTAYCNFSIFQSMPDHWAVKQLFPIVPIHRLDQQPTRRATLCDLTCDSDGKVDEFIDLHDVKRVIELHEPAPGESYRLGVFLVGAYQEILGDLHNLFGDTHAIHVDVAADGSYDVARVVEGDSVSEVLGYVQYNRDELVKRVRKAAEEAVRRGDLKLVDLRRLLQRYDEGLSGYTYLTDADGQPLREDVDSGMGPDESLQPVRPVEAPSSGPAPTEVAEDRTKEDEVATAGENH